ncbi:MAG: tRNA 4-thiouridine(8) synthase ThiI [Candidatus Omnitrophota bacterium]|nr:tRNA 4-thiouridine(8) synthase ThiI [Candidatus Omnitrophota bacterium]
MNRKAVILFSGGLDSILAGRLMLEQQIEIEAVNFMSVFFIKNEALPTIDNIGVKLKIFDITPEHICIVKSPQYGYGKNMNPCLDCRVCMLKKAAEYMKEAGASFLVTGEVLGERPMSQRQEAFNLVEKAAGLKGKILRPLSAKLLRPTIAEQNGIVNRNKLLNIQGRGRNYQIDLAKQKGISNYPVPSGGCLLTDPEFSDRLRELLANQSPEVSDIQLLKYGRHFRLSNGFKVIIARDEKEIECLLGLAEQGDMIFDLADFAGPITIVKGRRNTDGLGWIKNIAALTARYSKVRDKKEVRVKYCCVPQKTEEYVLVTPRSAEELGIARI